MKKSFLPFAIIITATMATSCTTLVEMQRTFPQEADLPADSARFVFINFYDFQIPDFIKDKDEAAYAEVVKGYGSGLAEIILKDPRAMLMTADTLRKGFTVLSMQYPGFADTVSNICRETGANMLVALDSVRLWIESEFYLEENDEGGSIMAKDFTLFLNTYMTLYTENGEVIDRCAGEKSKYIKSKYTIFGMIGGPTPSRSLKHVTELSAAAAKDCIGKFYPFTEVYQAKLYSGGPFSSLNKLITSGRPEEAVEPLTQLSASPDPGIAKKAASNLSVANEIIYNRRTTEVVWKEFREKGRTGN